VRALYVIGCLVIPPAWGALSVLLLRFIDKRWPRKPAPESKRPPDLEYYL
jgi:hypothetical protein